MLKPVESTMDFPLMEKNWLAKWSKDGLIEKYLKKNQNSASFFSFLDGPITANNPMGVHHAWGRTYKDLWQRFNNLLGKRQRFQNGFDCQGLWVEVEVEKELGLKNKREIENLVPGDKKASIAKFVELCKQRVYKYSKIQSEQSKRLGYFMDWDHSYFTMSDENNYMIWHFLKTCHQNGWIYKGRESVPWCPRCETAISQHEMLTEDYKEVVHESIYFTLPLVGKEDEYLLVWTTTPWTIPANIAVAIDKTFDYSLVNVKNGLKVWIAKERVSTIFDEKKIKILKTVKGKELVGLRYTSAFDRIPAVEKVSKQAPGKFHLVVATDKNILPISVDEGTGLVHTAVSAGVEDFKLGKKLGLPMIPVIGDNADYLSDMGILAGKNAKINPEVIFDYLLAKQKQDNRYWVHKIHKYKHRYPACWRCKTELVWKVEDEWYIAMDLPGKSRNKTLRRMMIDVTKKIKWMPAFGLDRELDWLKNMHDWLISKKNRYWGLALPIYECKKCGNFEVIGSKDELKDKAISGWSDFEGHTPHKPFIDEVYIRCSKCNAELRRINDVGNPWLDAGIVSYSTIAKDNRGAPLYLTDKKEWKNWFPVDFITESFPGQFKNWFYSLIAMSTVLEYTNPFKRVLGYGTLLAEDGRPMHKSWGNMIEFSEGADKIGVDVMRWMFVRHNPAENMPFGFKRADEVRRRFYLMLWNCYKFFIDYVQLDKLTNDLDLKLTHSLSTPVLDRWILSRLNSLIHAVGNYMGDYDAKSSAQITEEFVSDLSTWYIRRSRDRVWINSQDVLDKKKLYGVLYHVLVKLTVVLSSFMPFISEEMYTNLTGQNSVHLETWPEADREFIDPKLDDYMLHARKVVELGHSLRKEAKVKIRQPLSQMAFNLKSVNIPTEIQKLILSELNIEQAVTSDELSSKEVISKTVGDLTVWINTAIDENLRKKGEVRDVIRAVQQKRKELGAKPNQHINLTLPKHLRESFEEIRNKVYAKKIVEGDEIMVSL